MLEINFLQEDNESFINLPVKFSMTQLKNGNYVLSNCTDHEKLKFVLSDWQKKYSAIQNLEEKYNMFLTSYKKIHENNLENNAFQKNHPLENNPDIVINSFVVDSKNKKVKYPDGKRVFIGCKDGYLYEYSMNEKRIGHYYGKILNKSIVSMAKTFDNKSLFVCDGKGDFKGFDIATHKQVSSFGVKDDILFCIVTYDNKFLITADNNYICNLTKYLIRTKKRLNTWKSEVNHGVKSQNCSYDNKYQFIGYDQGYLGIFDMQKHKTFKTFQVLSLEISTMSFTYHNQGVYIGDWGGNIKMINWKSNANFKQDFDFNQIPIKVNRFPSYATCLTKDDKNLLVGSCKMLSVVDTWTKNIVKEFKQTDIVFGIKLITYGKNAIIAEFNGDLSIIDLEAIEITSTHKKVTNGKSLLRIAIM